MIIHDALPQQDHAELLDALHRLRDTQIAAGRHPAEQLRQPVFSPAHDLSKERVVQDLLVTPKVFPKVVDILGSNLFLYHGYIVGDRAAPPEATIPADMNAVPTFGWHQDSGMQNDIRNALDDHSHPISPRMSLKCAYYLTDCREVGCGNTWIVPGSVDTDLAKGATLFPADHSGPLGQPPGAIPVQVPANSCMIFDRRVWHAATPNWAQYERMVVFMGYGARWLAPRDAMYVEDAMEMITCPIKRQMLGATTQNSGLYHGNGLDIPLKQWLTIKGGGPPTGLGWQFPYAPINDTRGKGHAPMSSLPGEVGHATLPRNPERLDVPLLPFDAEAHFRSRDVQLLLAEPPPPAPPPTEAELAQQAEEVYDYIGLDNVSIDAAEYAAHRLTPAEAEQFERDGYVRVTCCLLKIPVARLTRKASSPDHRGERSTGGRGPGAPAAARRGADAADGGRRHRPQQRPPRLQRQRLLAGQHPADGAQLSRDGDQRASAAQGG